MAPLQKLLADIGAELAMMNAKAFAPEAKMGVGQSLGLADEQPKVIAVVKKTM